MGRSGKVEAPFHAPLLPARCSRLNQRATSSWQVLDSLGSFQKSGQPGVQSAFLPRSRILHQETGDSLAMKEIDIGQDQSRQQSRDFLIRPRTPAAERRNDPVSARVRRRLVKLYHVRASRLSV